MSNTKTPHDLLKEWRKRFMVLHGQRMRATTDRLESRLWNEQQTIRRMADELESVIGDPHE